MNQTPDQLQADLKLRTFRQLGCGENRKGHRVRHLLRCLGIGIRESAYEVTVTSEWPPVSSSSSRLAPATIQELNEDLYLRRSYLTLFLNGTGYQESKLES
jgi:hypothetical protein